MLWRCAGGKLWPRPTRSKALHPSPRPPPVRKRRRLSDFKTVAAVLILGLQIKVGETGKYGNSRRGRRINIVYKEMCSGRQRWHFEELIKYKTCFKNHAT